MNDDAKIMANLLKTGHTMLNVSCPICKNPIFQDKNHKKFCPICNREVIMVENTEINFKDSIEKRNKYKDNKDNITLLRELILRKIKILNKKLADESQIDLIDKYANILIKLLKILNYTKKYNQDTI